MIATRLSESQNEDDKTSDELLPSELELWRHDEVTESVPGVMDLDALETADDGGEVRDPDTCTGQIRTSWLSMDCRWITRCR